MHPELTRYFPDFPRPVLAVVARSGTGKTTLLSRLIPLLRDAGVRVAVIKHSHHDVEIDKPGKDSHRLREAGASQVVLASPYRTFWVAEGDGSSEPQLRDLLACLDIGNLDLVLLEGYRDAAVAKLEVYRSVLGNPPLASSDPAVIAMASDRPLDMSVPVLPLDKLSEILAFVLQALGRPSTG